MSPAEHGPLAAAGVSSWNWPSPTLDAIEFRKWFSFRFDCVMKNWSSAVKLMIVPAVGKDARHWAFAAHPAGRSECDVEWRRSRAVGRDVRWGRRGTGSDADAVVRPVDQQQPTDDDHEGRREGGQDRKSSHLEVLQGWPADRTPHLRRRLRGLEDGGDRRDRALHRVPGRARLVRDGRSRVRWSCHPSFGGDRRRVGLDGRAQHPCRIVESRTGGPGRDAERSRRSRSAGDPMW